MIAIVIKARGEMSLVARNEYTARVRGTLSQSTAHLHLSRLRHLTYFDRPIDLRRINDKVFGGG